MPPFCYRNRQITPNLNPYSVCLDCPHKTPCTTAILDEPGFDYVETPDKPTLYFTEEDIIQHEKLASDATRSKLLNILNSHLTVAKDELKKAYNQDAGKWMGANSTDLPRGKVRALELLEKELRVKIR